MTEPNGPSSTVSPEGRRVLVAVVTGEPGAVIQHWREQHDPEQARRLPPHTTLCYWTPDVPLAALEKQVRHAFSRPATVRLSGVREFDNDQHTFYVPVLDHASLDEARRRLYDGTYLSLPGFREWTWHVTCVRESVGRDLESLRTAASNLPVDHIWPVDRVACLELRAGRYETVACWDLLLIHPLVFLIDLDNTLVDHDQLKARLKEMVDDRATGPGSALFWQVYEEVREQTGIVSLPETARRFGIASGCPWLGGEIERMLWEFPFAELVYPGTDEALFHIAAIGLPVLLCDGDEGFQRHKLRMARLQNHFEGRILVFDHKEDHLVEVERAFPAEHYVMLDDKPRIHAAMRDVLGRRVTTVLVRQGHYARGPAPSAPNAPPDMEISSLMELPARIRTARQAQDGAQPLVI